jgi:hypothetical protein
MLEILNDFLTSEEVGLSATLKYGLPFYMNGKKMVCYLHKCKDGSLDVTFWQGKELLSKYPQLEQRDRKIMASLNYRSPEALDLELIRDIAHDTKARHNLK